MRNQTIFAAAIALLFSLVAFSVQAQELRRGAFTGASGHTATGHVTVLKTDKGTVLKLEGDFRFDGAPDPKLAFGQGGYKKEAQFSPLKKNNGADEYAVPSNIDTSKYGEVWIWCEKYNVPLGVAKLKR